VNRHPICTAVGSLLHHSPLHHRRLSPTPSSTTPPSALSGTVWLEIISFSCCSNVMGMQRQEKISLMFFSCCSNVLWSQTCKEMLMKPKNSMEAYCHKLKLNIDDTEPLKYFTCDNWDCRKKESGCLYSIFRNKKCYCGKIMDSQERGMFLFFSFFFR